MKNIILSRDRILCYTNSFQLWESIHLCKDIEVADITFFHSKTSKVFEGRNFAELLKIILTQVQFFKQWGIFKFGWSVERFKSITLEIQKLEILKVSPGI